MKKYFFLFALSALVVNSFAQTTYDVFTYAEPKGYKKEITTDHITYTKTDAKTGTYCIISLYAQTAGTGNVKNDFEAEWQSLVVKSLQVTDLPKAGKANNDGNWEMYVGSANFTFNKLPAMAILATATNKNNKASILCVPNAKKYIAEIDSFFKKVKLQKANLPIANSSKDSAQKIASKTTVFGAEIEGVWVSYTNRNVLTDRVKFNWRIFFKNGKSLLTIPDGGLHNFTNTADLDNYWGAYTFNNKKGILKSGNDLQFTDNIKWSSSDIILIQDEEYRKCTSVNGAKLNGSFSYYLPTDPLQGKLPFGQNPKITFTANGKFVDEGLFYQFLKDYSKDDAYNAAGKGTYELKDFSIILKYDDGRVKQTSFTIPASESAATANLILIGRASLFKMK